LNISLVVITTLSIFNGGFKMFQLIGEFLKSRRQAMLGYLQVCWPILGLVALVGAVGYYLLADLTRQQDRAYASSTRELVLQSVDGLIETNATFSTDYAIWNDAFENITLSENPEWLKSNYNPTNAGATGIVRHGVGLTHLYVKTGYAEARSDIEKYVEKYVASAKFNMHDAYRKSRSLHDVVIGPKAITVFGGHLATIAIQPIRPEPDSNLLQLNPNAPLDYVVFVNFINASTIEAIGRRSAIVKPELHTSNIRNDDSESRLGIDINDADGKPIARIDWVNAQPGTRAFEDRFGPLALILIVLCAVTTAVTQRLSAGQMRLSEEARLAAEEASHAKSSFLANISHELRTPLNAIIGYSEILEEDCLDAQNEVGASDAKKVSRSAYHLLALINDLLDHSKIEAGRMDLNPTQVGLGPLIEDVIDALRVQANDRCNQLILNYDPLLGHAMLDGMRLKQCLLNLTSNALKFTRNGQVTVSARPVVQDNRDFVRFSVKDTGIGMSAATIDKLFVPFVQADETTALKFGGTGLGLVITRRLIEAMGGSVTVESIEGQGSTFVLLVPRGMARSDAGDKTTFEAAIAA
jgi:signal transduction histidine kinase